MLFRSSLTNLPYVRQESRLDLPICGSKFDRHQTFGRQLEAYHTDCSDAQAATKTLARDLPWLFLIYWPPAFTYHQQIFTYQALRHPPRFCLKLLGPTTAMAFRRTHPIATSPLLSNLCIALLFFPLKRHPHESQKQSPVFVTVGRRDKRYVHPLRTKEAVRVQL